MKAVLGERKERESGKRKILKGIRLVTNETTITTAVENAEVVTQGKKIMECKRKRRQMEIDQIEVSQFKKSYNYILTICPSF